MLIDVQYLQKRGKAGWRYRRKVPANLRQTTGRREILIPLARTEPEALKAYPRVHAEVEKRLTSAEAPIGGCRQGPRRHHRTGSVPGRRKAASEVGAGPQWNVEDLDPEDDDFFDDDELLARAKRVKAITAKYPHDESGQPIGISAQDAALLHVLGLGAAATPTKPALEDAKRLYLKEKVRDDHKKELELERIFRLVSEALDLTRTLDSLRREDAKETRDYMLDGKRTASTVDRYLNVVAHPHDIDATWGLCFRTATIMAVT
jgi:hypothetical protein